MTSAALVVAIVGIGIVNFHDMRDFGRGSVVRGPNGRPVPVVHGGPPPGSRPPGQPPG